jgi:peroxiredoxin
MFGIQPYNYETFTKDLLLKDISGPRTIVEGPRPGEKAPDFEGRTLDGDKIRLSDFRGKKNLVLTFGSVTCPMTAGSIGALDELGEEFDSDEVQFLFIYIREAHPGEKIPAHTSMQEKAAAAELLRAEEALEIPILVDDLRGTIHRKYGKLPNQTFIIDKSGRVAFRAYWTQPSLIEEALKELLQVQDERGVEHAVVLGGEDKSVPVRSTLFHAYRALRRGGKQSVRDFEKAMGLPGRMMMASSRIVGPVAEHPGKTLAALALGAGVVAAGIFAGRALRERRFSRQPYRYFPVEPEEEQMEAGSDYGAVGI